MGVVAAPICLPPASVKAIDVAGTDLVWCDLRATFGEVAVRMMD